MIESKNLIQYGPNEISLCLDGFTVEQVEEAFAEVLNLPFGVLCYVDGFFVADKKSFVLGIGVTVFFWRASGSKGSEERNAKERQTVALERIAVALERVADHFDPPERVTVGTPYIAERLGLSTRWVGDLIRNGEIPKSCVCPKSGGGRYWRFWKEEIDHWIEEK